MKQQPLRRKCHKCEKEIPEEVHMEYHTSDIWREKNLAGVWVCPGCHKLIHKAEKMKQQRREANASSSEGIPEDDE